MRDKIFQLLKQEVIGPDPHEPFVQGNGEEVLSEPPRLRYLTGALFPKNFDYSNVEALTKNELEAINNLEKHDIQDNNKKLNDIRDEFSSNKEIIDDTNDLILNMTNTFLPSAMGFTCCLSRETGQLTLEVKSGNYHPESFSYIEGKEKKEIKRAYLRKQITKDLIINNNDFPKSKNSTKSFMVYEQDNKILELQIRNRSRKNDKYKLFTFALINKTESDSIRINNSDIFFQVELSLSCGDDQTFHPLPNKYISDLTDDEKINNLLFRKRQSYALGHGCSVIWNQITESGPHTIQTSFLPRYELKPVLPKVFEGINLSMHHFSKREKRAEMFLTLEKLVNYYDNWIDNQESSIKQLPIDHVEAADLNINNAKQCSGRIKEGIVILKKDENSEIINAFHYMNEAMLLQQLRYNLPVNKWKVDSNNRNKLYINNRELPDIDRFETWPDWDKEKKVNADLGCWRPFQLAFILMNLKSIVDNTSIQRKFVDLIWFPTGGGKTEAYLGLTAFLIFLKKLKKKSSNGTMAIMRYTLRLLTNQQFQRASSLICACEYIRTQNTELGENNISIGLWAGDALTPNTRSSAVQRYRKLDRGNTKNNPFLILKCPWCATEMGKIKGQIKGYEKVRRPSSIKYLCENTLCDFSINHLPLNVIDEDIYQDPPTLVIGTVDKFASLHWKPETHKIFGISNGERTNDPPELIIQDELHLISGPLGSMVGHYETLIHELCSDRNKNHYPKIIGSTATISRAKEQCHNLYNCGIENVIQFPPQGLETGDSFFSYVEENKPGRLYVGVTTNTGKSHVMSQIIVHSALLQAVSLIDNFDDKERDPYWSMLMYYNSLRELGAAATHLRGDIPDYLNAIYLRKSLKNKNKKRRFINNTIELTSRVPGHLISYYLEALTIPYSSDRKKDEYAVDACLATNMISVGIDISRLGIMTIIGQPKTTSEYIQASSRVGRSELGPGLIVTIYNPYRPRDKSIYEDFFSYHSSLYSRVEPTSVTPFSSPVRERSLHSLIIGLIRSKYSQHLERPLPLPDESVKEYVMQVLKNRVNGIISEELNDTIDLIKERFEEWKRYTPPKYGKMADKSDEQLRLMYPAGSQPHPDWEYKAWPSQTSMRNVDKQCEASIIQQYPDWNNTDEE